MKNELRIIGGTWRSRKIRFPATPELRPTPDRLRETLFNWLGQDLEGLLCLDLYAGSGALGFEAASRGAARVVQVERGQQACQALKQNCELLQAKTVEVVTMDVDHFLAGSVGSFDLVFLDPPFHQAIVETCCQRLETRGWLTARARIYIETESNLKLQNLPHNWRLHRHKQSGEVACHLFRREAS